MTAFDDTKELGTVGASSKVGAFIDVHARNKANSDNFTQAQKDFAEDFYHLVSGTFLRSTVYRNFRQNFIAIKVDNVQSGDLATLAAAELEAFCKANDISVKKTQTKSLIFEIR